MAAGDHLLTQLKNGISALDLSRQLGLSYNSAWLVKHKLMQAMLERERGRSLQGVIQLDDAYWGGRRCGYKRGRKLPRQVDSLKLDSPAGISLGM